MPACKKCRCAHPRRPRGSRTQICPRIALEKTPIVVDEAHVLIPVPVGARTGMAIDPAAGAGTAGYLIVADYVLAVYGDLILLAAPRRKPCRSMVHTSGKPLRVVYVTRVFDAD